VEPEDMWYSDRRKVDNVFNGLDLDVDLYRVLPVTRFLQILAEKKLTLLKPHKWDDPFENVIYSSPAKTGRSWSGSGPCA
jgi:hypothetical protein